VRTVGGWRGAVGASTGANGAGRSVTVLIRVGMTVLTAAVRAALIVASGARRVDGAVLVGAGAVLIDEVLLDEVLTDEVVDATGNMMPSSATIIS